jgi:hypothetical protein
MRRRRQWCTVWGGALTAAVLAGLLAAPAGARTATSGLPDNQPSVPGGNPDTAFARSGPYKAGVAFETTSTRSTRPPPPADPPTP